MPADFVGEVSEASAAGDAAKLMLLGFEVEGLPWQNEANLLLAEAAAEVETFDRVILFAGHRIDSADRKTPRFPPSAEASAREAIRDVVRRQMEVEQGRVIGISGGANGGDILFLEICREEGLRAEMLLALPPAEFIKASVEADSGDWVERFERLWHRSQSAVLAQSKTLPNWLSAKPGYDIWQRNDFWLIARAKARKPTKFRLLALWDGTHEDGLGGTGHMVGLAQQHGAELIWLNTREIFGRRTASH